MKGKTITVVMVTIILVLGGLFAWNVIQKSESNRVSVEPIEDGKGIFVGEQRPQYKESDPTKWSSETRKRVEDYESSVKAIDESWKNLSLANSHFKAGRYDDAIQAYKKAYEINSGNESFFGMELLKAHEKLGRFDDALALLDEIETKYYKNEYGMKKAQEIRERLLAGKNQMRDGIK